MEFLTFFISYCLHMDDWIWYSEMRLYINVTTDWFILSQPWGSFSIISEHKLKEAKYIFVNVISFMLCFCNISSNTLNLLQLIFHLAPKYPACKTSDVVVGPTTGCYTSCVCYEFVLLLSCDIVQEGFCF